MPPFIPSHPSSLTIWRPVNEDDFVSSEAQQLHLILANPSLSEIVAEFRKKQNALARMRLQCLCNNYSAFKQNNQEVKILRVFAVLK
jgi:hypothetical protein